MDVANYLMWLRESGVVAGSGSKRKMAVVAEEKRIHRFWQPWLREDDAAKQNATKQLPTTKWKRDRRTRPEYLRKSDPKFPEAEADVPENGQQQQNGSSSNGYGNGKASPNSDAPLDMTVKQRGLPPSYSQAISDPSFRSSYRPSVIANCVAAGRDEIPSGISMCDPIIDEHFRRSLGKDYNAVFSNNNVPKEAAKPQQPPPPLPPPKISTNVIELMDSTGLSVDDHFAKALGDTWLKLNKKDAAELKNNPTETHGGVVTH